MHSTACRVHAVDRKQEGILPNRPIRENLTLSNLRR